METRDQSALDAGFQLAQRQHVLGTPVYLAFSLRNRGPHPITFSIGNGRSDGYRFTTGGEATTLDPYHELGGLSAIRRLLPGEQTDDRILLNKYLHFSRPGRYTVNCELDLAVTDATTGLVQSQPIRDRLELNLEQDAERRRLVLGTLAADMEGKDPQQQLEASYVLSELREKDTAAAMIRGLRSRNSAVVENLLVGLGRIDSEQARTVLRDFANSTASPELKALARQQLSRAGH
jgi:hypothetical protein